MKVPGLVGITLQRRDTLARLVRTPLMKLIDWLVLTDGPATEKALLAANDGDETVPS